MGHARGTQISQDEGGAELGHELLGGVGTGAEPAGEVTGEAVGGAGPMHELVCERTGVARRCAEGGAGGQVDRIGGWHVAGVVAAMLDSCAGGRDERVKSG